MHPMCTYLNLSLGQVTPTQICLIEGADGTRLVSFNGRRWHGEWQANTDPLFLDVSFDCQARDDRLKKTRLLKEPALGEHKWSGHDYQSREVEVAWQSAHLFLGSDSSARAFFEHLLLVPHPPQLGC